jgi:hypothetical protein
MKRKLLSNAVRDVKFSASEIEVCARENPAKKYSKNAVNSWRERNQSIISYQETVVAAKISIASKRSGEHQSNHQKISVINKIS